MREKAVKADSRMNTLTPIVLDLDVINLSEKRESANERASTHKTPRGGIHLSFPINTSSVGKTQDDLYAI